MDYKEKYEQALERARQFSEKPYLEDSAGIVEYVFPELKESEDERIRKELISFVRGMLACHDKPNAERDEKYESWIAWLEKQGEQKPAWSEKDQEIWEEISVLLWEGFKKTHTKFSWNEIKDWIKPKIESLKVRAQSQSQWKPSDEQMGVIEAVINNRSFQRRHLDSLYNDLKKLREEQL